MQNFLIDSNIVLSSFLNSQTEISRNIWIPLFLARYYVVLKAKDTQVVALFVLGTKKPAFTTASTSSLILISRRNASCQFTQCHTFVQLCKIVGPLWAYSTFGFEKMNGHITKHRLNGNRNFLPSISRAISMHYTIPKFRNKFLKSENSRTITFLGSGDKCIPQFWHQHIKFR